MGCGTSVHSNRPSGQIAKALPAEPVISGLDKYRIGEELGRGHFAKVCIAEDKQTGQQFAIKIIDKNDLAKSLPVVKEEVEVLKAVGTHKYIVSLQDYFEDAKEFYLVMDLCMGGDLFTKIVEDGGYSELKAAECCRQLAEAIAYLHSKGVAHRDLKPENILLTDHGPHANIKVADFGLSKLLKENNAVMKTVCGTWAYCAPEVINRKPYGKEVDTWTLGVLMFILLSGYHPFDVYGEMPEPALLHKISTNSYDFDDPAWETISGEAKRLITKLLVMDPKKRMSIEQYLASPWVQGEAASRQGLSSVVNRMKLFNKARHNFRTTVLVSIASKKFKGLLNSGSKRELGLDGEGGRPSASSLGELRDTRVHALPAIPSSSNLLVRAEDKVTPSA